MTCAQAGQHGEPTGAAIWAEFAEPLIALAAAHQFQPHQVDDAADGTGDSTHGAATSSPHIDTKRGAAAAGTAQRGVSA